MTRRTATSKPLSTKGHEEPRRTATATPFVRGGRGGARRTATATAEPLSTKGHEVPRRRSRATPFCPRRATKNCNCNIFCARRGTAGGGGTGEETGAGAVRPGFGGGRCGGAAPAQGRPLAADRPNTIMRGERTPLLGSFRGAYQLRLSRYVFVELQSSGKLRRSVDGGA